MSRLRAVVSLLLAAACVPTASAAQTPETASTPASSAASRTFQPVATTAPTGGPRIELTASAMRRFVPTDSAAIQPAVPTSVGKSMALMIVGGAAILLGAIIDGDVGTLFMVGGAGSVLVGLYQYLK